MRARTWNFRRPPAGSLDMNIRQTRAALLRFTVPFVLVGAFAATVVAAPPAGAAKTEQATFAAGCFWSMEAIFKQLKGVQKAVPGYAGGAVLRPSYEQVGTGTTGHAETLNISFDPRVISYSDLLKVLLTVHNPTTRDKQGADEGPQYRSIIFYRTPQQKTAALEAIRQVTAARTWKAPIVTEVKPFKNFYAAEDYHLDYYRLHPDEAYCRFVIAPKIEEFRAKFARLLK